MAKLQGMCVETLMGDVKGERDGVEMEEDE